MTLTEERLRLALDWIEAYREGSADAATTIDVVENILKEETDG